MNTLYDFPYHDLVQAVKKNDPHIVKEELNKINYGNLHRWTLDDIIVYICENNLTELFNIFCERPEMKCPVMRYYEILKTVLKGKNYNILKKLIGKNDLGWYSDVYLFNIILKSKDIKALIIAYKYNAPLHINGILNYCLREGLIDMFDISIQYYNNKSNKYIDDLKKYIYDRRTYTAMIDVPEELNDIICEYFICNF
jgi:hypothetical protein